MTGHEDVRQQCLGVRRVVRGATVVGDDESGLPQQLGGHTSKSVCRRIARGAHTLFANHARRGVELSVVFDPLCKEWSVLAGELAGEHRLAGFRPTRATARPMSALTRQVSGSRIPTDASVTAAEDTTMRTRSVAVVATSTVGPRAGRKPMRRTVSVALPGVISLSANSPRALVRARPIGAPAASVADTMAPDTGVMLSARTTLPITDCAATGRDASTIVATIITVHAITRIDGSSSESRPGS